MASAEYADATDLNAAILVLENAGVASLTNAIALSLVKAPMFKWNRGIDSEHQ